MRFRGRWVGKGAAFLVMVLALISLLSYVVMSTVECTLIPELFHGPLLGFWQAAGLLVLCKILFGGLARPARSRTLARASCWKKRQDGWREQWVSA